MIGFVSDQADTTLNSKVLSLFSVNTGKHKTDTEMTNGLVAETEYRKLIKMINKNLFLWKNYI